MAAGSRRMVGLLLMAMALTDAQRPSQATTLPRYTALYAFGDAWSDAGNAWIASKHTQPATPYSGGRYTNGAVWLQDLATQLSLAAPTPSLSGGTDFAIGGGQTGSTTLHKIAASDLPGQFQSFAVAVRGHAPSTALYTVSAGSDDLQQSVAGTAATRAAIAVQVASNVGSFISQLAALGARRFLVLGVPDLGKLPSVMAQGSAVQAQASALATSYNATLRARLVVVASSLHVTISLVDVSRLLNDAIASPSTNKFTNVTQACWTGGVTGNPHAIPCAATVASQNAWLFWDPTHVTASGHQLVASGASMSLP